MSSSESEEDKIRHEKVFIFENGILSEKDEIFIKECITKIMVNNRIIEIMPAINEHIRLLGMGYLYQTTDLTPDILMSGKVEGSDFYLEQKDSQDSGCVCKKIFTSEKTVKLINGDAIKISNKNVFNVFINFNESSAGFRRTAALHGAGLYDQNMERIVFMEDIARSNTIYKLTGFMIVNHITAQNIIVLSCRVNTLILNLLINIGFKTILTRASVTYDACIKARKHGITLIGFIKENRFTIFSGIENVLNHNESKLL